MPSRVSLCTLRTHNKDCSTGQYGTYFKKAAPNSFKGTNVWVVLNVLKISRTKQNKTKWNFDKIKKSKKRKKKVFCFCTFRFLPFLNHFSVFLLFGFYHLWTIFRFLTFQLLPSPNHLFFFLFSAFTISLTIFFFPCFQVLPSRSFYPVYLLFDFSVKMVNHCKVTWTTVNK